ncbi:ribosome recycling factor [Sabulicella glaciei]|uniref:Ribosome-recycling factor n=1 Tax=Sabulicella glaciei TaxID=2984948 RepID=A0ABT3NPI7_9PROT|nr:ribosome recycling factor [Roseococcus sp. MDT2-1-1]MCW8084080.1 ribosome recycling factor [Roseococcus sp. MDT2-1-1]
MAAAPPDKNALRADLSRRMDGAMETLKKEFSGLRTGRASPALLENIRVEAYGANQALNQLANVSVGGPSMLVVQVFDRSVTKQVEVAIRDSGLNLNPQSEGQTIRINLPPLTEQRRNELAKMASKYAEGAKVAIRGVRRDGMEQIQGWKKKSEISEDDAKRWSDEVQKLTDDYVKQIDTAVAAKEKDIKTV